MSATLLEHVDDFSHFLADRFNLHCTPNYFFHLVYSVICLYLISIPNNYLSLVPYIVSKYTIEYF